MAMNHLPCAACGLSPSLTSRENFLVRVDRLQTFALRLCSCTMRFGPKLYRPLARLISEVRSAAFASVLRKRFALGGRFEPSYAWVHGDG